MEMETLMYLLIAFVCALVLIVLAKFVLQFIIRRPEDYYTKAEARTEDYILSNIGQKRYIGDGEPEE